MPHTYQATSASDVDDDDDDKESERWVKIEHSVLYSSDREVIESGSWLNYNIVSAAQNLMKSRHPHIGGLQNTILQRSNTFEVQ